MTAFKGRLTGGSQIKKTEIPGGGDEESGT